MSIFPGFEVIAAVGAIDKGLRSLVPVDCRLGYSLRRRPEPRQPKGRLQGQSGNWTRCEVVVSRSFRTLAVYGALGLGCSGSLAASAERSLQEPWRDPYTLVLPSPEQYKLAGPQADSVPSSSVASPRSLSPALGARPFDREIAKAAGDFRVDPALVHAVIKVESGYNVGALSPKGAQGLMQLLPDTARRFGVATADLLWKPERNIRAGVAYLRSLLDLFDQDLALVLAAYNAGENAVLRHGRRIPPFPETQDYVPKVLAIYERLRPPIQPDALPNPAKRVRIQYPPPLPEAQPDSPPR